MTPNRGEAPIPVFVGTAGWSIPRPHRERFHGAGSHLERYALTLPAVEINTSFYRPHRKSTYERWAASTPDDFRFSVKAPKQVTHATWSDVSSGLDAFFDEIAGLGGKLGPLLIQLPPKRSFETEEAARFLEAFRMRTRGPIAIEPRHASWFDPAVDALLCRFEIARVAADPARAEGGDAPAAWPGLAYFRLHGSPDIYRSPYGEDRLQIIARQLRQAQESGSETWCIFDNTTSYAAAGDALDLLRILEGGSS